MDTTRFYCWRSVSTRIRLLAIPSVSIQLTLWCCTHGAYQDIYDSSAHGTYCRAYYVLSHQNMCNTWWGNLDRFEERPKRRWMKKEFQWSELGKGSQHQIHEKAFVSLKCKDFVEHWKQRLSISTCNLKHDLIELIESLEDSSSFLSFTVKRNFQLCHQNLNAACKCDRTIFNVSSNEVKETPA